MNSYATEARLQFEEHLAALRSIYGKKNVSEIPNGVLPTKVGVTRKLGRGKKALAVKLEFKWASRPCGNRTIEDPPALLLPKSGRKKARVYACPSSNGFYPDVYLGVRSAAGEAYWQLSTSSEVGRKLATEMKASFRGARTDVVQASA